MRDARSPGGVGVAGARVGDTALARRRRGAPARQLHHQPLQPAGVLHRRGAHHLRARFRRDPDFSADAAARHRWRRASSPSAETTAYLDRNMPLLTQGLRLVVGDSVLPLRSSTAPRRCSRARGPADIAAGSPFQRASCPTAGRQDGRAATPTATTAIGSAGARSSFRAARASRSRNRGASQTDISDELRTYPADCCPARWTISEATFTLAPGDGSSRPIATPPRKLHGASKPAHPQRLGHQPGRQPGDGRAPRRRSSCSSRCWRCSGARCMP